MCFYFGYKNMFSLGSVELFRNSENKWKDYKTVPYVVAFLDIFLTAMS